MAKTVLMSEFFEAIDLVSETNTRKYKTLNGSYLSTHFSIKAANNPDDMSG